MQVLFQKYSDIRNRINCRSIRIPTNQHSFFIFLVGFFYNKIHDIDQLYDLIETLQYCKIEGKLNQIYQTQLMQILYNDPKKMKNISILANKIAKDQKVNILLEVEFLTDINSQKKPPKTQSKDTIIIQEKLIQQHSLTNSYTQQLQQKQKNQYQSQLLARKLHDQQLKRIQPRIQDDAACQICFVGLYQQQFHFLENCSHLFHKNCLQQSFKMQILDNRFPLVCPNDSCKHQLQDVQIKSILDLDLYKKYQQHTLKSYADMHGDSISWCPTADCGYLFFYQKNDDVRFRCQQCRKQYCLNCRVQWHNGMTCKQFKVSSTLSQQDAKFLDFVKGKKFKQCPKCKFWVQKNQGCDHMTCKCGFQFCYKCGGIYMKCQCVQKAKQLHQRRLQQAQLRRQKKLQRQQKKKQKQSQQIIQPKRQTRKKK